jgi:biotin synthase-related radical SAM superfamily protein
MLAIGNQMDVVVDKKTIVHQSTILGWSDEDMVELRNVVKSMKTKKSASATTPKKATNA